VIDIQFPAIDNSVFNSC